MPPEVRPGRGYTGAVAGPDPAVLRFIARHSKPPREAVDEDVARWRDASPEERFRSALQLCADAAAFLAMNPNRERVLALKDEPDPSYFEIMSRLRERGRAR